MGKSQTHVGQLKTKKDISAVKVTPEDRGVPALHRAPQSKVPVLEREVPILSGCGNQ